MRPHVSFIPITAKAEPYASSFRLRDEGEFLGVRKSVCRGASTAPGLSDLWRKPLRESRLGVRHLRRNERAVSAWVMDTQCATVTRFELVLVAISAAWRNATTAPDGGEQVQGPLSVRPFRMIRVSPDGLEPGHRARAAKNVRVDQAATNQRIHSARPDRDAGPTLG